MNHLEQLVSEWYEFQGYFIRRNVHVGKRPQGGWECELDIIAFNPSKKHIVHIEPSMDANSWAKREERYKKKFEAGLKYIPVIFEGLDIPKNIEQIALFGLGSKTNNSMLAGGHVLLASDLLLQITKTLRNLRVEKAAVPEQFPLLRTIQFVCQHEAILFKGVN
jgi:hypothetical protein